MNLREKIEDAIARAEFVTNFQITNLADVILAVVEPPRVHESHVTLSLDPSTVTRLLEDLRAAMLAVPVVTEPDGSRWISMDEMLAAFDGVLNEPPKT